MSSSFNQPPVLRVVCLGDSITGPKPRLAYQHQYLKFSDLLQVMLEARVGLGNAVVLNRGWAGQHSGEGLARIQSDVLDEQPHIAIVLLGGNDNTREGEVVPPAQTAENLSAIYSTLKNEGINVLALQYPYLPPLDASTGWHWLDKNNPVIAEVAAEVGVPLLNMGPLFLKEGERKPREELVNILDGVHLNPGGEIEFARAIFARMDELGWVA